eukprot:9965052-Alexandrium_andersonii.AAC.1
MAVHSCLAACRVAMWVVHFMQALRAVAAHMTLAAHRALHAWFWAVAAHRCMLHADRSAVWLNRTLMLPALMP